MSNFEQDTKKLVGKVRIEDVQAEIDRLIQGINDAIDTINDVNNSSSSINPTLGGDIISSSNYTLTCAGLKKILDLYKGLFLIKPTCVLNDDGVIIFPALLVKPDGTGCKAMLSILDENQENCELVYHDEENDSDIHCAWLDFQRGENILNTTPDNIFINPDEIPRVTLRDNAFPVKDKINIPDDRAFFFCPMAAKQGARSNCSTLLANTIIYRRYINTGDVGKHSQTLYTHNPIFIPKGLENKITFTTSSGGKSIHKALDFTIE